MKTINKLPWRNLRVGDSLGKRHTVAAVLNTGVAVVSDDIKYPDGLLLPLATRYGDGRVDDVIRAQKANPCYANVKQQNEDILTTHQIADLFGVTIIDDYDLEQNKFGPWNSSLRGVGIVVFDFETTGLDPIEESIIEIGAAYCTEDGIQETFGTFINPERPIPPESTTIHGITDAMVRNAPVEEDALRAFLDFCEGAQVLAGHNIINFDCKFLRASIERCSYEKPHFKLLDTLNIARGLLPRGRTEGKVPNHRLQTLVKYFGIDSGNAHRALDDAVANAKVLNELLKLKEQKNNND